MTRVPPESEIAAVGRVATFGSLFDCRTNTFIHLELFSKPFDRNIIRSVDNWQTKIGLSTNNSFDEKFNMLDISAELKLSILSGLIEVNGSGHFLKDVKKSARCAKANFVYSVTTKYEHINIIDERITQCISNDMLSKTTATHVVVGIGWGGRAILSVEDSNSEGKDTQIIEGNMEAVMKKLKGALDVHGNASVRVDESVVEVMRNFEFKLFGDLLSDTTPQTIAEALEFIRIAPTKIKQANDGRGKAMTYMLVPIQFLRDLFEIKLAVNEVINHISRETIRKCVSLFDDMNVAEQKLNDMMNDVNCFADYIDPTRLAQLKELRNDYETFQDEIRERLAGLLNTTDEREIVSRIEQTVQAAKDHQLSPKRIEDRLPSMSGLYCEIDFIKFLKKTNVEILNTKTDFKLFLLENKQRDVIAVCYNFQQTMDETMVTFFQLRDRVYRSPPLFVAINLCLAGVSRVLAGDEKLPTVKCFRNAKEIEMIDATGSDDNAGIYRHLIRNETSTASMSGRPLAVLIGPSGVGKTTLINSICGTVHSAQADMSRVTNNLTMHNNMCGKHSFAMIDTPGNDDETDCGQYASLIIEACAASANSVVFLVLRYESRFEKIVNAYWQFDEVLEGRNVVILISHMDWAENPKSDFETICGELDGNGCTSSNVIFYSDKGSMHSLADSIYTGLCGALN